MRVENGHVDHMRALVQEIAELPVAQVTGGHRMDGEARVFAATLVGMRVSRCHALYYVNMIKDPLSELFRQVRATKVRMAEES